MKEIIEILLSSPLVWLITITCIVRGFWRYNDKGLLTEKDYYHSLHSAIQEIVGKKET